jgi:AcrR family transcriptional regulator
MAAKQSEEEKLVAAAIAAIRKSGWPDLSLASLARKSKLSAEAVYRLCPDKTSLLKLIVKSVDIDYLAAAKDPDAEMSARDRAFDEILRWFDCLKPVRDVLQSVHEERRGELASIVDFLPLTSRSAPWIAECAGLPTTGWKGALLTRGLAGLVAETLVVWLKDGDEMEKTMAHLDRRLRTLEEWQNTIGQALRNARPRPEQD